MLLMATELGGPHLAARLEEGDRLRLGAPHPQGGGKVFWATVDETRSGDYVGRVGVVRREWVRRDNESNATPISPASPNRASSPAARRMGSLAPSRAPANSTTTAPGSASASAVGAPLPAARAIADKRTLDRGTMRRRSGTSASQPFIGPPAPPIELPPAQVATNEDVPAYSPPTDPEKVKRLRELYETDRLLPPFFDPRSGPSRIKATRDAYLQWGAMTHDLAILNGVVLPEPDFFDTAYEEDPDYIDQYYLTLEHYFEHPPVMQAKVASTGGAPRALTVFLAQIFPKLVTHGRQVIGIFKIGAKGGARGHHIFAKAAFPKAVWNRMLSISEEAMQALKWNHKAMSKTQGRLYRSLFKRGGAHTMKDHIKIALAALKAGGATRLQRRWIVAQALRNLREAGVRVPHRIPTFGRPPI